MDQAWALPHAGSIASHPGTSEESSSCLVALRCDFPGHDQPSVRHVSTRGERGGCASLLSPELSAGVRRVKMGRPGNPLRFGNWSIVACGIVCLLSSSRRDVRRLAMTVKCLVRRSGAHLVVVQQRLDFSPKYAVLVSPFNQTRPEMLLKSERTPDYSCFRLIT